MPEKLDGPARLLDIDVDEVSLVDKAANKRKFLVVKNDQNSQEGVDDMADEKVKRVKKQGDNPELEAAEAEGTPITDAEAGIEKESGTNVAATDDGAEAGSVVKEATTMLTESVKQLTGIVTDLAGKVKAFIPAETQKGEAGEVAEKPEVKPEVAATTDEAPDAAVTEVEAEKAGAKISKVNLGKLTTAYTSIKALLMELGVDVESGNGGTVKKEAGEPEAKPDLFTELSKMTEGLSGVTEKLGEVSKRLDAVEGLDAQSKQAGDGAATEPVKKSTSIWDGAL